VYPFPQRDCAECIAVEMYVFPTDTTVRALVDSATSSVHTVRVYHEQHPEINKRLKRVAQALASSSPEVREVLGSVPRKRDATMANVRTSLRNSVCEYAHHLCVAPTFLDYTANRATWAIVDLAELRVIGVRQTALGENPLPAVVSERALRDEYIYTTYCQTVQELSRNGWHVRYRITPSDGLEIVDVRFGDRTVLNSAKVVDWHVAYARDYGSTHNINDSSDDSPYPFGYSDAMGCPLFSTSAVVAFDAPYVEEIMHEGVVVGFALIQDFRNPAWPLACNYRYENRYEFYQDGSVRITAANYGRGCGDDGWYRPVFRIDPALGARQRIERVASDGSYRAVSTEEHFAQFEAPHAEDGALLRIIGENGTYAFIPNRGQLEAGMAPDNAYMYISRDHEDRDEGREDLLTIGSCCRDDIQQGPEIFIRDKESLSDASVILWYVPQIKNSSTPSQEYCWARSVIHEGSRKVETFPCRVGPLLKPITE